MNIQIISQKVKSWWANIISLAKQDISSIWKNTKIFIIPLVLIGVIIKYRDIIISILVNSGKRIFQNAQNKNDKLQNKENSENQQADQLVQQADDLPKSNTSVDDNWYKGD